MRLIALIAASEPTDGASGQLRALVPLGGMTVLERQAQQLVAVGVELILLQVASFPPELTAVIDRIKARGVDIVPLRRPAEMLTRVLAEDRLMLVADGLHADAPHYRALSNSAAPAIMVTGDLAITQDFERIDATARWAGLAVVNGGDVADLADLPGDWDMLLTLLRKAVQAGAHRIPCDPAMFSQGEIAVISNAAMAEPLERRAMQQVEFGGMGLGSALAIMPLVRLLGPPLLRHRPVADAMPVVMALAGLLAMVAAWLGSPGAAALAAIVACLTIGAMRFLRSFRAETTVMTRARTWGRHGAIALLAIIPIIGIVSAGLALPEALRIAAPVLTLALLVGFARALFAVLGKSAHKSWLLPDAEAAWMVLAPLGFMGWTHWSYLAMMVAAPLQYWAWLRFNRSTPDDDAEQRPDFAV